MNCRLYRAIFITLLFSLANLVQAAIPQSERAVLLALYMATDGDNWHSNSNSNWNGSEGTECSWYGVSCDAEQTTVTDLALSANNLKGSLPGNLVDLVNLTSNDFRYNAVYSDNTSLINFLDASGPVGSLLDTQTLDADGIVFSNLTSNSVDVSWNPVTYMQDGGGYRVYMAEQIDSDTGSVMTDFVMIADVASQIATTASVTGLVTCRQYYFKILSYSDVMVSDGIRGPVVGTIPGFSASCSLIGSPFHDVFNISSGGDSVVDVRVSIAVDKTGHRVYDIIYPGNDIVVGSIDGAIGDDDIFITATASITILSDSHLSASTLTLDTVELGVMSETGLISYISSSISSGELIDVLPLAEIDSAVFIEVPLFNLEPISVPEGSTLVYGEGFAAIISGFGTYDLVEDAAINSSVTTVNVEFLLPAQQMGYQISSGNGEGVFTIDNLTGEITLVKPLDFESVAQYLLEVSASDGEANYVGRVTVNVTDVTEEDTAAAGCSLHHGAPFDPVWLFTLVLLIFYRTGRVNILK